MRPIHVYTSTIAAFVLLSSCAHQTVPIDLAKSLTLEVAAAPSMIAAGTQIEVTFLIHNSTNLDLSLCSPGGVTTYLQSESPAYVWPVVIHGFTTDTYCSGPFHLPPGGEMAFVERGGVRKSLPASSALVVGKMSLSCDPRKHSQCRDTQLQTSQPVMVQSAP